MKSTEPEDFIKSDKKSVKKIKVVNKVKTRNIAKSNVKKPAVKPKKRKNTQKFLTATQKENFNKLRTNYNTRINRQVKNYQKIDPNVTYETLARAQAVNIKMIKKLSDIKSKEQYNILVDVMKKDKTKKYQQLKTKDMRETMKYVIMNAYFPSPKIENELDKIINSMSDKQIVEFRLSNPKLIADYFEAYKLHMSGILSDADNYEKQLKNLVSALRKFNNSL